MKEILGINNDESIESSPEVVESEEGIESQIEEVEEERASLLYSFLTSRIVDKVGNAIPVVNLFKQIPEIVTGYTTSGREIGTGRQKFIHAIEMVAVNAAWVILYGEYTGNADAGLLSVVPALKAASNINNTKEALLLSKDTILSVFGAIKYISTDKEFHEMAIAAITALPADMFSNEIVELNLRNA